MIRSTVAAADADDDDDDGDEDGDALTQLPVTQIERSDFQKWQVRSPDNEF
jgi:hypothetical protein